MVGSAALAQAGDGGGEGGPGVRVAVARGEAAADQVPFGSQHGRKLPGRMGVEQGEQLARGGGVVQLAGAAGGQRPSPAQAIAADAEHAGVSEHPAAWRSASRG